MTPPSTSPKAFHIPSLDGKLYTEEMLANRKVLGSLGFNHREVDFLARHERHDLPLLFY